MAYKHEDPPNPGSPLVLSLRARLLDPYVFLVFGAPSLAPEPSGAFCPGRKEQGLGQHQVGRRGMAPRVQVFVLAAQNSGL